MHELVDVGGVRLRVSIRGRGRPLLLCNGIGASLELLDPLRQALTSTETIAVDMPGSGGSPATALPRCFGGLAHLVASLLDVLGYGHVDVLGVSWGGALAQELTLRHPARVRRLVLAATSPGWPSVPGSPSALWALATPRRYYQPSYFATVAPTLYGGAVRDNPGLLGEQGHLRFIHPPSVRGYLWQLAAALGWSSVWRLHRIECPTLILAADDDPIIPLANARLIAWRVPRSTVRVVDGGGHLFLITHASLVAPWIESFFGRPMSTLLIGLGFLVLASSLGFEASPGRAIQYPFAFGAFALFLAVGPSALGVVALATGIGLLLRWPRRRRRGIGQAGPGALVLVAAAVCLGIVVAAGLARLCHVAYPLPMGGARSLFLYLIVQGGAYVAFVLAKELAMRRPHARGVLGIYVAGFVLGAPIQLAAHALYDAAQPLPWTIALAWTFVINAVLGRQLERMRRQNELVDKLRRQRRLAAIGEMTARVLHHTRHQMGMVGMIAHQIAHHLDGCPETAANPIREELTKLAAVRDDLQQALTGDLGDSAPLAADASAAHRSYETLIRTQTALLQPLAAERAIDVHVEVAADASARLGPNKPVTLAQAFLNVLENAISAATRRVTVQLGRQGGVVTITVSDDGPGIEPSLLLRATEPFVTTKAGSSGMGLAITRAVVEEEEGELHLANGAAGGLVVQMRLPLIGTRSRSARAAPPGASDPARRAPAGSASRDS